MADQIYLRSILKEGAEMDSTTYYFIGLIGIWFFQDAAASIAFYPSEKWRWNHTARLIRFFMGLYLMIIAGRLI